MALSDLHMQWPTLEVSTAPAVEPVCLDDLKAFLQYDDDDQDGLITSLGIAAREELERVTQLALITQTVKLYLPDFPGCEIEIRKPPVSSITSVQYTDTDGDTQTVSSANYQLDSKSYPARLWPVRDQEWPNDVKQDTLNAVTVTFVAGYGDPEDVPERVKTAIKVATKASFDGCESGMMYDALVDSLSWNRTWG